MNPLRAVTERPVRVALAALTVLSFLFVPGLGPATGVWAQDPEVAASAVTQNVSGSVSLNLGGTRTVNPQQTFTASTNVAPTIIVRVNCWGSFTINSTISLAGNMPATALFVTTGGTRTQGISVPVTGSKTQGIYVGACASGVPYIVQPVVPVTGSATVTWQSADTGVAIPVNGTVSGTATVWVTGNARLILYAYLPTIAKQDQPTPPVGGPWSDDFSTNKGWKNLSPDVCDVELVEGTMRVTLKKGDICWISTPDGVSLSQGTFTVDATRTSDKKGWYGLVFNATTKLLEQRWQFDVAQWSASDGCESGKSKVKLSYKDGDAGNQWVKCTSEVNRSKNEWNKLKVVRSGDSVKAYVNDNEQFSVSESRLKDAGYFDLVVFGSEAGFVMRFDNFDVR